MTRQEYLDHLLGEGLLIQKKCRSGMLIIYNEKNGQRAALPVTDPPTPSNIWLTCRALDVIAPSDPEIFRAGDDIMEFRKRLDAKDVNIRKE